MKSLDRVRAESRRIWDTLSHYTGIPREEKVSSPNNDPDPEDLNMDNAYKTRWIWYHTILALELFVTNMLLFIIVVQNAST